MIIDFNCLDSVSIETFAIKKNDNVKLTTNIFVRKNTHVCKAFFNEFHL